jgi:hypothetical protein
MRCLLFRSLRLPGATAALACNGKSATTAIKQHIADPCRLHHSRSRTGTAGLGQRQPNAGPRQDTRLVEEIQVGRTFTQLLTKQFYL